MMSLLLLATMLLPCDSLPHHPEPLHRVPVGHHRLVLYEGGTGQDTLLLIHGLGSNLSFWRPLLPHLSNTFYLVAPDLPGYGLSTKEDVPGTMTFFAQILHALMDTLGLQRVTLVGHSMGGQIAMTLALMHPERIARVILLAPAGIETFTPEEAAQIQALFTPEAIASATPEQIRYNVALNFARYAPERFDWVVTQRLALQQCPDFPAYAEANARSVTGMLKEPVAEYLTAWSHPTLVLWGEEDRLIPNRFFHPSLDILTETRRCLSSARVVSIPDAGHLLQVEQPKAVAREICRFLR